MALQARHRFLIKRVEDALLPGNEQLVEDLVRDEGILARINSLFSPEGVQSLIFTFYPPDASNIPPVPSIEPPATAENDEKKESNAAPSHAGFVDLNGYAMAGDREIGYLLVTLGTDVAITGKAIFFMKTRKGHGINPTKSTDTSMSFGIINNPLKSLEVLMRNLYRPMLTNASAGLWGKASPEEKNDLMVGVDNFVHNLGENLKSLNSGLELRKPDPYVGERAK